MSIEAIPALSSIPADAAVASAPDVTGTMFDSLLSNLSEVNTKLLEGQQSVARLAAGDMDNLHQVMMNLEQTRLTFELALAVRNKVLEAYQELMRMQV
jgi:flagellar hook-basal body complex protein FliE